MGRCNMEGRCIVQKFRPSSNLGVIALLGAQPPKMWRWATTLGKSAQAVYLYTGVIYSYGHKLTEKS